MNLELKGKKALVTGSTRGIGRAIVECLADEGVDVAICSRNAEDVRKTIAALEVKGITAIGQAVDVCDGDAYKTWIQASAKELGGLDIFVANVTGSGGEGEQSWRNHFDADVMGTVRGCEVSLPYLKASDTGAIVVISSIVAVETFLTPSAYNAFKAAIINYAKHLSQQVGAEGIRVNSISPGATYHAGGVWESIESDNPALYQKTLAQIPLGRMGAPEEIAKAVVFLASPASSYTSGTNLIVDGGYTRGVQY